ncbi:beta strand repeat-containing protein, partial [Clostridium tarantellae]|uniref:beta strand repeat-containing protein n=1 Tax=Clostridium tarantellae TaxID=39493 RepID=UPI0014783814
QNKADVSSVGDTNSLSTSNKVIVDAINEVKNSTDYTLANLNITTSSVADLTQSKADVSSVGDTNSLSTSNKVIVDAINEVKSNTDFTLANLNITTSSVADLTENKADVSSVGDTNSLSTSNKVIVDAINEVKNNTDFTLANLNTNINITTSSVVDLTQNKADVSSVGDTNSLSTSNKVIVDAINEVKNSTDYTLANLNITTSSVADLTQNKADVSSVGDTNSLSTSNKVIVDAINEVKSNTDFTLANLNITTSSVADLTQNKADVSSVGDTNSLSTSNKVIVDAINEVKSNTDFTLANLNITTSSVVDLTQSKADISSVGDTNSLSTSNKVIVDAINEVKNNTDFTLANLNTNINITTSSVVDLTQNKVDVSSVGDTNSLSTSNKVIVDAINEVKNNTDFTLANLNTNINITTSSVADLTQNKADVSSVGDTNSLSTSNKVIVDAINEVKSNTDFTLANLNITTSSVANLTQNKVDVSSVGDTNSLSTSNKVIVDAINEVKSNTDFTLANLNVTTSSVADLTQNKADVSSVGDTNSLSTSNKVIVDAINEVKSNT